MEGINCDGDIVIRRATKEDMPAVAEMIRELADFEKMPDGPRLTVEDLQRDGFESTPPRFLCAVAAEVGVVGAGVLGYALYFPSYSTWRGAAFVLEDLYVRRKERGRGVGGRLFRFVAQEAVKAECCRVDFHVLEWNPARQFYARVGAVDLTECENWHCYRLDGEALKAAASSFDG